MQHTQTCLKLQATVVFQRLACLSSFCLIEGLKYLKGESIAGCRDKKIVRNDSHDGSFNCYWQANILSLS